MGKANRQRRKAGERAREKDRARGPQTPAGAGPSREHGRHGAREARGPEAGTPQAAELVGLLVDDAVRSIGRNDPKALAESVALLTELADGERRHLTARVVERTFAGLLNRGIAVAWRGGWQPADLVRYAAREHGASAGRMMTDAIAAEMRAYAPATVDPRWPDQLSALRASVWWDHDDTFLTEWARREGGDRPTAIVCALKVIALLRVLPQLERLCPPPGEARSTERPPGPATQADRRMLDKIRALLAKAESTEFPEEAEALTARAQQLMTRYSIDHALLAAQSGGEPEGPGGRRLPIESPYESPKAALLTAIARANRCRAVWNKSLGFSTVVGFPAALDAVELLFTSLLVQANAALVHEGGRRGPDGRSRTRSFRHAFLTSYAVRIGERLTEATGDTEREAAAEPTGAGLLPVLAARDQAVDEALDAMFPKLVRHRMTRVTDRDGWLSGLAAADRANLTAHTPALDDRD